MDRRRREGGQDLTGAGAAGSSRPGLTVAGVWAALAALTGLVTATVGRYGFNPTDEGLVVSYTARMLRGEVPHRDFISPRPVGSSLLHAVDLAIPGPLLVVGRLVFTAEVVAATALLAVLVLDRPIRRWSAPVVMAVAAAALVNLNTFPMMSWYTADGILLTAGGFVALRSERRWVQRLGLVLVGVAVLTKQSFAPALPIGVLTYALRRRSPVALVEGAAVGGLPVAMYVAWMAAAGGFGAMVDQLLGFAGPTVFGQELLAFGPPPHRTVGQLVIVAAGALVIGRFAVDGIRGRRRSQAAASACVLAAALVTVAVVRYDGLVFNGRWATVSFWAAAIAVAGRTALERKPDWSGLGVLAIAWMTTLSLGAPTPGLVAGSLLLLFVVRSAPLAATAVPAPLSLASMTVVGALVAVTFVDGRRTTPYRDAPAATLTSGLAGVDPDFAGILTNTATAAYVRTLDSCVDRHPAARVAVLPDNAGLYPVLGLRSPFPIDWLFPQDLPPDAEARFLAAARRAGQRRDGVLVLYQTQPLDRLHEFPDRAVSPQPGGPYDHTLGWSSDVLAAIGGRTVACGPFIGRWLPPSSTR